MEQPTSPILNLSPLSAVLPLAEPFTPAQALAAGVRRSVLDRMHREGRIRRILRGVYVDAIVPNSRLLRAQALTRVISPGQVIRDRTAAWLYGVEPECPTSVSTSSMRDLKARDLTNVHGVRVTTALRTALDLGRLLPPDPALAALDGLLRLGDFTHTALMAEPGRFSGQSGVVQLRELAAMADARALDCVESILRLRWCAARLPTPIPALVVGETRLPLGLAMQRFGAVLEGRGISESSLRVLASQGWRVVVLPQERVLSGDPSFVIRHLEREYHQHLLSQVS